MNKDILLTIFNKCCFSTISSAAKISSYIYAIIDQQLQDSNTILHNAKIMVLKAIKQKIIRLYTPSYPRFRIMLFTSMLPVVQPFIRPDCGVWKRIHIEPYLQTVYVPPPPDKVKPIYVKRQKNKMLKKQYNVQQSKHKHKYR